MILQLNGLDSLDGNKAKAKAKKPVKRPIAKKKGTVAPIKKPVIAAATAAAVTGAVVLAATPTPQAAPKPVVTLNPNPFKQAQAQAPESTLDKLIGTVQQALPVVLSSVAAAKNQKRIDKIQEQRLAAGKEPLSAEEIDRYMDATAPVVKVKGGVDTNTNKTLLIGGVAVVGLLAYMATKKKGNNRG